MSERLSEGGMVEIRIECIRAAAIGNGCQIENRLQSLHC